MATASIRPLVAGNWKMNGLAVSEGELTKIVNGAATLAAKADLMICPPATLIADFAAAARGSAVTIGGQNCHAERSGAHTGDIAAEMLADAGAQAVIVGHSERRADHHETDAQVRAKAQAAWRAGLMAIVCCGEQRAEREAGQHARGGGAANSTDRCLTAPPAPIWWSPTSRSGRSEPALRRHRPMSGRCMPLSAHSSESVSAPKVAASGSCMAARSTPANAKSLLGVADVNGALVGGASLKADDFLGIVAVYR